MMKKIYTGGLEQKQQSWTKSWTQLLQYSAIYSEFCQLNGVEVPSSNWGQGPCIDPQWLVISQDLKPFDFGVQQNALYQNGFLKDMRCLGERSMFNPWTSGNPSEMCHCSSLLNAQSANLPGHCCWLGALPAQNIQMHTTKPRERTPHWASESMPNTSTASSSKQLMLQNSSLPSGCWKKLI